ncbi:hypothetical protein GBP346_A1085 [Burkholderia pseudomallei MSHR346]|nr:hypothetical protein GBP346_A1085 [Burkholderia pseudomallei MSHR346]
MGRRGPNGQCESVFAAWRGALHALAREAPATADGRCGWDTERGRARRRALRRPAARALI